MLGNFFFQAYEGDMESVTDRRTDGQNRAKIFRSLLYPNPRNIYNEVFHVPIRRVGRQYPPEKSTKQGFLAI